MNDPDLNLLFALDVLLAEKSVAGAARRLNLSASAMSRTLSRLREATGDPLLVRAGRQMVLTPYADSLRERTQGAVFAARAVLRPAAPCCALRRRNLISHVTSRRLRCAPTTVLWRRSARRSLRRLHDVRPAYACVLRPSR